MTGLARVRVRVTLGRGRRAQRVERHGGGGGLHNLYGLNRRVAVDLVASAVHGRVAHDSHPVGAYALVEGVGPLLPLVWLGLGLGINIGSNKAIVWPLLPRTLQELVGSLTRRDEVAVQQKEQGHQTAHEGKVDTNDRR